MIHDLDLLLPLESRGAEVVIAQTDLCPALVIRARANHIRLFADLKSWGLEGPTRAAVPTTTGLEILARRLGKTSLEGDCQTEPWVLCWFEGGMGWDQLWFGQPCHWRGRHPERPFPHVDVPWLVVLQHRATQIELGEDGLDLLFPDQAGTLVAMPLYGTDFVSVERTRTWRDGLPDDVRARCRRWSRYLRRVPIGCRETFTIDEKRDFVAIEQAFDYLAIEDQWKTPAETIAPYPPFALLAARYGFPLELEESPLSEEITTLYGPYGFRRGAQSAAYKLHGLLRYIKEDETYPDAPCTSAAQRAMIRLRCAFDDDPLLAAKTSGGYTRGLALALSSYAHALRYLAAGQKPAILEVMSDLLAQILDSSHYTPLIRYSTAGMGSGMSASGGLPMTFHGQDARAACQPIGEAICQGVRDAYKIVPANLAGVWAATEAAGDWERVRQAWPLIRRWFHLPFQTQWLTPLPGRWEGLDIARALFDGTLGFARLAARVGSPDECRLACYLFAKVCAGWFAMEQMPNEHREHRPWLFNTDADYLMWHPCRLNGYVLIANDHLLSSEQPEADGRGWASAYGRLTPTSARFWRDLLRERANEVLNHTLPRCRPDWADAGAPLVMRSYVLGESAEKLEKYRAADEAAEKAAARDPLRLRTYHLFQSTPVFKEIAAIEAGAKPSCVPLFPEAEAMSAPQEGASRTACRMEQAAMPVRIESGDETGAFPLLYWPGVRTPRKSFVVLDERLDVLPFGFIKWHGHLAHDFFQDESLPGKMAVLPDSPAGSPCRQVFHPNWCLTVFTHHSDMIEAVVVKRRDDSGFAISWSMPVPTNATVQYWRHDLAETTPRIETIQDINLGCEHDLVVQLPPETFQPDSPEWRTSESEIQNPKSEIFMFRVLSFDGSGRLYRSRMAPLPTGRTNWALGCTVLVSKRFPFKEFKYASDREVWLEAFRSKAAKWNLLKPPHELTDGQGLRPGVEPWIRHAESDPSYVHWIAIDLGEVRPVDEIVIAHDPAWVSAGYRVEAGPSDTAWLAALAGPESRAWGDLLAEATENRVAVSCHRFVCRRTRWIRIVYTHPAPVGLSANRVALWEIEVRGPDETSRG